MNDTIMKKSVLYFPLFFAFLMLFQVSCTPRTPRSVPMDEELGTTGLPEGVRAPMTAEYPDYAGRYRITGADFDHATISVQDGRLYGQVEGRDRVELMPGTDKDQFNVPSQNARVNFIRDAQNRVTGIQLMSDQGSVRGEKVE
jgi:hypothetical protein